MSTSFASLVTASLDDLAAQLDVLADLVDDGHLAGVHLEGPFLSVEQPGAHQQDLLRAPGPATVDRLVEAGEVEVLLEGVHLAPERVASHGDVEAADGLLVAGAALDPVGEQDHPGTRPEGGHAAGDPFSERVDQVERAR